MKLTMCENVNQAIPQGFCSIIKGRTKGRSDKKASLIICLLIWRAFGFAELNKVPSAYGNSIFALSACEFIAGCDISQNWDRGNYRFL